MAENDPELLNAVYKEISEKLGKLDQLADASERGVRDIQGGIGGVKDVVDAILDDLSVQEKKKIYDLDTPTGIAELEPEEKEYLLAVLFTIAEAQNEVTEYQRFYLRTLKAYLGVVGVQSGIDFSTIENIESITTQKILLQTVMEFLYLAYQNHNYMSDYADLFDYFSVNRRGVTELQQAIDHMAALLGLEGIACHYSPLAEPVEMDEEETLEDEQETCAHNSECSDNHVIDSANNAIFKMQVEDVWAISGRIVVTGIIEEGCISLNDEVTVFRGSGGTLKTATVCGIELNTEMRNHAKKGDNVGLWLRDASKDNLNRGDILIKNTVIKEAYRYECEIYVRRKAEGGRPAPIFSNYMPQFRFDKSEITGVITLPDGMEMCMPGDTMQATVIFESAVALMAGERFLVVEGRRRKDERIVGSGVVVSVAE